MRLVPYVLALVLLATSPDLLPAQETARLGAGRLSHSITYVVNGTEVTRTFRHERTPEGMLRIVETTGPNGRTATGSIEWIMGELGYIRIAETAAAGEASVAPEQPVTRTDPGTASPEATVIGPDGNRYRISNNLQRTDAGWTRTDSVIGPNGETATRIDDWVRTGDRSWTQVTSSEGSRGFGATGGSSFVRDGRAGVTSQGNAYGAPAPAPRLAPKPTPHASSSRGRGTDDPPGHMRRGRGADDKPGFDDSKRKRSGDSGKSDRGKGDDAKTSRKKDKGDGGKGRGKGGGK